MDAPLEGWFAWKISNFSKILEESVTSDTFSLGGYSWNVQCYPKGSGVEAEGYVSLFVNVANHSDLPAGWEVYTKTKFMTQSRCEGIPALRFEGTNDARAYYSDSSRSWGHGKCFLLDTLNDVSKGYLNNDCLEVEVHVSVLKKDRLIDVMEKCTFFVNEEVRGTCLSPDGSKIAIATESSLKIWNTCKTKSHVLLHDKEKSLTTPAWSAQITWWIDMDNWLACADMDGGIEIWNGKTHTHKWTLQGYTGTVTNLEWSPNGRKLAAGTSTGEVHVWDSRSGVRLESWTRKLKASARQLKWSPNGEHLSVMDELENRVYVWNETENVECSNHSATSHSSSTSNNTFGKFVWKSADTIIMSGEGELAIWHVKTGKRMRTIPGSEVRGSDFALSPVEGLLVWPDETKGVHIIDLQSEETHDDMFPDLGHETKIVQTCWSTDGTWLTTQSEDGVLRVHNRFTRKSYLCDVGLGTSSNVSWHQISYGSSILTYNSEKSVSVCRQIGGHVTPAESCAMKIIDLLKARTSSPPPPPTLPPATQKILKHIRAFVDVNWPTDWTELCGGLCEKVVRAESAHREFSEYQEVLGSESHAVATERVEEGDRLRSQLLQALEEVVAWEWQDRMERTSEDSSQDENDLKVAGDVGCRKRQRRHQAPQISKARSTGKITNYLQKSSSKSTDVKTGQNAFSRILHLDDVLNKSTHVFTSLSELLSESGETTHKSSDLSAFSRSQLLEISNELSSQAQEMQERSKKSVQSVTEWRDRRFKVYEDTTLAIKKFGAEMANDDRNHFTMHCSAAVLDETMQLETEFRKKDNPKDDVPNQDLVETGMELCSYASKVCAFVQNVKAALEWAHNEINRLSEV